MWNKFQHGFKFFLYLLRCRGSTAIRSALLRDLHANLIRDFTPYYAFAYIEAVRRKLHTSAKVIEVADFGAGASRNHKRPLSGIIRRSSVSAKDGQLLFRLVNHFQPKTMLELGTSLGISAMYQAAPDSKAKLYTIEGCPCTAALAREYIPKTGLRNVEVITGTFENALPPLLNRLKQIDHVFIDGDHRCEPAIACFSQCLPYLHEHSLVAMHDIHHSSEMEKAWKTIRNFQQVTASLDLFSMGLLFFRKELENEEYCLRF